MTSVARATPRPLDPAKFRDPVTTAKGEKRAFVGLRALETLWFNTGTLCNLTCPNCYIESSPTNDRLAYLTAAEVSAYLDEIADRDLGTREIGFTGGEPFMNPDLPAMLADALARGHRVLVLTNAMRPMMKRADDLRAISAERRHDLILRVSIDHYTETLHDLERGKGSFAKTMAGLEWLLRNRFNVAIAGRMLSGETDAALRAGYARLFAERGIRADASDPSSLVIFPEMDAQVDVPEITTACWSILGKSPNDIMCSASRMVVKRKGAERPTLMPCTLLPYDVKFEIGHDLGEAGRSVSLNHPHCAKFCVLGGGSCGVTR